MKKLLIAIISIVILLTSCASQNTSTEITSLDDLREGKRRIGVSSVTDEYILVEREFPNAEILYYSEDMGAYTSVARGKIDAFVFDRDSMEVAIHNGLNGVKILDETLEDSHISGVAFSPVTKIPDLETKVNTFLAEAKADGTLEDMARRWVYEGNDQMPDINIPESSDTHLVIGTTGTNMPFTYYVGPNLAGYDIELAYRFAAWLGATMEFKVYDYDGIIPATQVGEVDAIFANLFVTPERSEALKFSDPTYIGKIAVMVRDGNVAMSELAGDDEAIVGSQISDDSQPDGFIAGVKESFEKTFIREERWKLFIQGIATTLIITVASIILGTILGFFVFMLGRKGNPVANAITEVMVWLVQGMPVVVLLMILYYIIFGQLSIPGAVVSIIGFTLVFGSGVYNMIKAGVGAIDKGQTEAAYTLGYTDKRAFYKVILPQALPHFMPAYKGEITSLIKATAIVGYVAVQDLTKMADIVRSRTYDAFFPLIAVAVIYFILAAFLKFIVGRIERKIDPRRSEKDIMKGVY